MILKVHPSALPDVLSLLQEKGLRTAFDVEPPPTSTASVSGAVSTATTTGLLGEGYYTVKSWSAAMLQDFLSELEPISLSKDAMQAMVLPGKRKPAKHDLVAMLEFVSGLSVVWSACGELRLVANLLSFLQVQNNSRGRRARELRLPPDWDSMGIYTKVVRAGEDGEIMLEIQHRFTGDKFQFGSHFWEGSVAENIMLNLNYSETKAELIDIIRPKWSFKLVTVFLCHLVAPWRLASLDVQPVGESKHHVVGCDALEVQSCGSSGASSHDKASQSLLMTTTTPVKRRKKWSSCDAMSTSPYMATPSTTASGSLSGSPTL